MSTDDIIPKQYLTQNSHLRSITQAVIFHSILFEKIFAIIIIIIIPTMSCFRSALLLLALAVSSSHAFVVTPTAGHYFAATSLSASQVISDGDFYPQEQEQTLPTQQQQQQQRKPALIDLPRHTADYQVPVGMFDAELAIGRVAMVLGVVLLGAELSGVSLPLQLLQLHQ